MATVLHTDCLLLRGTQRPAIKVFQLVQIPRIGDEGGMYRSPCREVGNARTGGS
jgi:hypothetical protein